jgi:hypothetical protein
VSLTDARAYRVIQLTDDPAGVTAQDIIADWLREGLLQSEQVHYADGLVRSTVYSLRKDFAPNAIVHANGRYRLAVDRADTVVWLIGRTYRIERQLRNEARYVHDTIEMFGDVGHARKDLSRIEHAVVFCGDLAEDLARQLADLGALP